MFNHSQYRKFCLESQKDEESFSKTNLTRHIARRHNTIEEVKMALLLPLAERPRKFDSMRKEGVAAWNKLLLKEDQESMLQCVRRCKSIRTNDDLIQRNTCDICYSRVYYHVYKRKCQQETEKITAAIPIRSLLLTAHNMSLYHIEVLPFYQITGSSQEIGQLCRQDQTNKNR